MPMDLNAQEDTAQGEGKEQPEILFLKKSPRKAVLDFQRPQRTQQCQRGNETTLD